MSENTPTVESSSVLDALPDGVYVVDRRRTVTSWNPAAERLSGYAADEVVGHRCGDGLLNHVDEEGRLLCGDGCPLAATLDDGLPRQASVLLHHRDGHLVPVTVRAAPLRDAAGAVVGAVETFRRRGEDVRQAVEIGAAPVSADLPTPEPDDLAGGREEGMGRRPAPFGVLILDLDRVGELEEGAGGDAAGRAWRVVSETVRQCLPPHGRVFRYGDDRLLALVADDHLATLGLRLCAYVEESRVPLPGEVIHVTVSIGATTVGPGDDVDRVLRRAERLLDTAKRAGGNCAVTDVALDAS